jgi:hypothetical protein
MNTRCPQGLEPASMIATFAGSQVTLRDPTSCQLVLLPVVVNTQNGSSTFPATGSGTVTVVGFSWWIVTAVKQGGKEVDAVYVGPAPTDPNAQSSLPSAYQARLTG